jgi:hypothetical protein
VLFSLYFHPLRASSVICAFSGEIMPVWGIHVHMYTGMCHWPRIIPWSCIVSGSCGSFSSQCWLNIHIDHLSSGMWNFASRLHSVACRGSDRSTMSTVYQLNSGQIDHLDNSTGGTTPLSVCHMARQLNCLAGWTGMCQVKTSCLSKKGQHQIGK